jgi:protein ERP2
MRLQLTSALPSAIFSVLFGSFLARSIPGARATALTTYLAANERSCFYADVDGKSVLVERGTEELLILSYLGIGEKVGFYFSVQSGGSFDIDYMVQDPYEKVILEGQGERQGDFIFTANTVSRRPPRE